MKNIIPKLKLIAAIALIPHLSKAQVIDFYTPEDSGVIVGTFSSYLFDGFNNQTGSSVNVSDTSWLDGNFNRMSNPWDTGSMIYLDFGANYADIRISSLWVGYIADGGAFSAPYATDLWWDTNTDSTKDGVTDTALLNSFNGLEVTNSSSFQWVETSTAIASPITPAARYLIITTVVPPDPLAYSALRGGSEFLFQATVIPEPSYAAGLLGLGVFVLMLRRKRLSLKQR